ncbi:MAG: C69 family dipeptidase [Collinsella sp.]
MRSRRYRAVQWMAFGSNSFNALVPLYANVEIMPEYYADTQARVTSENFYWANRLIGALADVRSMSAVARSRIIRRRSAAWATSRFTTLTLP